MKTALSYPAEMIRCQDRGRFLTTLFAPSDLREDLFALHAFAMELSQVRIKAREPIARLIRLQWWRDVLGAVDDAGRAPSGHPVAEALAAAVTRHRLSRGPLEGVVDAWEEALERETAPDAPALIALAETTCLPLAAPALAILGVDDGRTARAVERVAVAWGMAGLLRTAPAPAVAGLAAGAEALVAEARRDHGRVPRAALPLLLPARLLDGYLERSRRRGYAADELERGWRHPGVLRLLLAYGLARF
ncbi:MAG: squalene/phytoene synthase family protein [Alphaproteobacteria bacterium]|nr:squalene/phytoene synthase family protein [Alphaproteobacteria bacterium]